MAGHKFTRYCQKETCVGCTEMHLNAKARRMCYDDRYNLPQDQPQMRYRERYKGAINSHEFSRIEAIYCLPEGYVYNQLIASNYLDKSGNVIGTKVSINSITIPIEDVPTGREYLFKRIKNALANRGRTHIVATGVIGSGTYSASDNNHANGRTENWEENFDIIVAPSSRDHVHILQETCKSMKVDYGKFMNKLMDIADEVLNKKELANARTR